ncbi:MAG: arginine repressor [Clostridia bacterium]|nr:arginine repressor [Clostridia bacterium]
MKTGRHDTILRLIRENPIDTQAELLDLLKQNGYDVTQATVSRDLKDLRLIKALGADGRYHYTTDRPQKQAELPKFHSLFDHAVLSVDYAENMLVIKCASGIAQGVCASLDALQWKSIVGTLAGDDTIFCVMRSSADAAEMAEKLNKMK